MCLDEALEPGYAAQRFWDMMEIVSIPNCHDTSLACSRDIWTIITSDVNLFSFILSVSPRSFLRCFLLKPFAGSQKALWGLYALVLAWILGVPSVFPANLSDSNFHDPESVIRLLVQANANKDLETMKRYMGKDPLAIGYTIGGRKFIGWDEFARVMEEEFSSVLTLQIPITYLEVRQRENVAWFAMELDYIRKVASGQSSVETTIPLRETGVLERQHGQWVLVNWHESLQNPSHVLSPIRKTALAAPVKAQSGDLVSIDLSGEWEIKEEDKSYRAILDVQGNGTYNWQGGTIRTIRVEDRLWEGTWSQTGNDREGGFEVLLAEDFSKAEGVWWYTRVEKRTNIPPRITGGSYVFIRLTPPPSSR